MKARFVLSSLLVFVLVFPATIIAASNGDTLNPTRKGRFLLDFELGGYSSEGEGEDPFNTKIKYTRGDFLLQFGYTIIEDLEVGVSLGLFITKSTGENELFNVTEKTTQSSVRLFVRYFFGKGMFKPFVKAHYAFGTNKRETTDIPDVKIGVTGYGGGVGVVYFINDHFGLELQGLYTRQDHDKKDDSPYSVGGNYNFFRVLFGILIAF